MKGVIFGCINLNSLILTLIFLEGCHVALYVEDYGLTPFFNQIISFHFFPGGPSSSVLPKGADRNRERTDGHMPFMVKDRTRKGTRKRK